MAAGYDNTTWFYERLSKLVFGRAQIKAQEVFLSHIKKGAHILIIGGGTGQILESISSLHPSGLRITYTEISSKMMALSRKRYAGTNEIKFVTEDIALLTSNQNFDVVLTAFLFDNFSDDDMAAVFPKINEWVKPNAIWLDTDFQLTGPYWQKLMLSGMYAFFRIMKAVKVSRLPNVQAVFGKYNYQLIEQKNFYNQFIYSRIYQKLP